MNAIGSVPFSDTALKHLTAFTAALDATETYFREHPEDYSGEDDKAAMAAQHYRELVEPMLAFELRAISPRSVIGDQLHWAMERLMDVAVTDDEFEEVVSGWES